MEVQTFTSPMLVWFLRETNWYNKQCLTKPIGRALLTFQELEEILSDRECFMNYRPLAYLGQEFEQ